MDVLPKNAILKYKPDTLNYIRKQYGFDTSKQVNDAIDLLEEWIKRQDHFEKKTFDRGFLERLLMSNKGSIEKCKKKLDKLCTQRTFIPELFTTTKINRELFWRSHADALLSELTPDHGRVLLMRYRGEEMVDANINLHLQYFVLMFQYVQMKDYCNHFTVVVDWQNGAVLDFLSHMNPMVLKKSADVCFQGFSLRLKGIHFVIPSKTIEAFISILKLVLGSKLGKRVYAHKTMDTVYKYVPKEILPQEYGGNDKSISILKEELFDELYSPEFTEYRNEMNKARTNEALRQKDKFNEEYSEIYGTFRSLSVD